MFRQVRASALLGLSCFGAGESAPPYHFVHRIPARALGLRHASCREQM